MRPSAPPRGETIKPSTTPTPLVCIDRTASFLSLEQRRRREHHSSLPRDHDELAVLCHTLIDPTTQQELPARLIFVYSTARERACRKRRQQNITKIQTGLEALQAKLQRGHPQCTAASITRQVIPLLDQRQAGPYFTWQLRLLTSEERSALPTPARGHRRATHALAFHCDAAAAQANEGYDGVSVLVTTAAANRYSADALFSKYQEQNYLETLHHPWKTPLAVSPVFLKSPRRVEALVGLLPIALQAYQVLERLYRQSVPAEASPAEKRTTAERLLRIFQVYGLVVSDASIGRVVHTTHLSSRQKQVLQRLRFPIPAQILVRILRQAPSG